jgi:peroxiredoxin
MLPLCTPAPDFSLPDTEGNIVSRASLSGPLLVAFISNHCPYVKHISAQLAALGNEYQKRGVSVVAIGSNDSEAYPDDAPDAMREEKARAGYEFPYLHDATQEVAKAFRAACTPDFFLFDNEGKLVYRGQMDGARPHNDEAPSGRDLRAALDAVLNGMPMPEEQKPSLGCNIKWKPGNEPDYFG